MTFCLKIIYTGGTLGMEQGEQGLVPASGLEGRIQLKLDKQPMLRNQLKHIRWSLQENRSLLDSANIGPPDWEALARQCLKIAKTPSIDALVIIHGTDTLAYTSSALAFLLQDIHLPIILTGSQKPLSAPHSDALGNLVGAMLKAQSSQAGIWVFFDKQLMPGARVVKKDAISSTGFDAPRLLRHPADNDNLTPIAWQPVTRNWASIKVASIRMVPGYHSSLLRAVVDSRPQAIILSLYGLGTLANQNTALLDTLDAACRSNIIVVAVSQCYIGYIDYSVYASGAELSHLGVLSGRDITFEAAYTKLMVLLRFGYQAEEIKRLFVRALAHEMNGAQA